jgi:hypothetical protein
MLLMVPLMGHAQIPPLQLDEANLNFIGEQIFRNECQQQLSCLTAWNAGEDFPSLGIGHFIWYRASQQEPFEETFPQLLEFMQKQGLTLPSWLAQYDFDQPWPDRQSFLAATSGAYLTELRTFLYQTMPQQTGFIVFRFGAEMRRLLASTTPEERSWLEYKISLLLNTDSRYGLYALIDYIHFKGSGTNPTERYQEQGWGLLQVLQSMPNQSQNPLKDFVATAKSILRQRVALAPAERQEQRWLLGWSNRLDSYLPQTAYSPTQQLGAPR